MKPEQEPAPPSIAEVAERVQEDLLLLRQAAARRRDELVARGRRFVEEHPFVAVGAAFAVGWVLSGALLSRTTLRLAGLAGRLWIGPALGDAVRERLGRMRGGDGAYGASGAGS